MTALLPLRFPCPEDRYWIDDLLNAILLKPAASYMCVERQLRLRAITWALFEGTHTCWPRMCRLVPLLEAWPSSKSLLAIFLAPLDLQLGLLPVRCS